MDLSEQAFPCPYCGTEITMLIDLSVRRQSYVEDCEVCCRPIELSYSLDDDSRVASLEARRTS